MSGRKRRRGGGGVSAAHFDSAQIAERRERWQRSCETAKGAALQQARAALPMAAHRDELLRAIAENQVVLVAGETGCGKTTQARPRQSFCFQNKITHFWDTLIL